MTLPALVIVSGPPGSGKTTLAHELAAAIGCPAICRDEIKEGMAHATPGFTAAPGDELTQRALPVFFGVLNLLVGAGVTTVAEAAFGDYVWRPRLEPLRGRARIRVVHCLVRPEVAAARIAWREQNDPRRRVHAAALRSPAEREVAHRSYQPPHIDAPSLEVGTEDGYHPPFGRILTFIEKGFLPNGIDVTPRFPSPLFRVRPPGGAPAVHRDDRPGDEAGLLGQQVRHRVGHLLGASHPAERVQFGHVPPGLRGPPRDGRASSPGRPRPARR